MLQMAGLWVASGARLELGWEPRGASLLGFGGSQSLVKLDLQARTDIVCRYSNPGWVVLV